ncbi:hypothetical protein GGI12_005166, partial [Dipsacomyces acuminosporus]
MLESISNNVVPNALKSLFGLAQGLGYASLLATLVVASIAYRITYALFFSPLRNIPGPFLARLTNKRAEVLAAIGKQGKMAQEEYEKYGDIYMYQPNAVSISNPDDVRAVLGTHNFRKTDLYRAVDFLDRENLVSTPDPELANLRRRQLGPYFNHTSLANMEDIILNNSALAIKKKWEKLIEENGGERAVVNYYKDCLYATFDTVGALLFGKDFSALKNDDSTAPNWIAKTVTYLGTRANFRLLDQFPFKLILKPWESHYNALVKYSGDAIKARRQLLQSMKDGDNKPFDLLQAFIEAEDPESKIKMSPVEVHSESLLMLLAGSETTAGTLMWTLHLLTLYPLHYKRAVDEVRSQFDKDYVIRYAEGRRKLPFLEACIHESLRLIPVTGGQWPRRTPKGGVTIRGHFIPEGTEININFTGSNIHKETWPNPYVYDPERFLNDEEAKRKLLTFSIG